MKIAVLSCANTGNFGDDIILEGIKIKFSREYPDVKGSIHQMLRINKQTLEFINQCDFLAIGGGELLSKSDILEQITSYDIKIPYMFLSVGVGDRNDIIPYLAKSHPAVWYVRTFKDLKILNECGVLNAEIQIDPIFECPYTKTSNGKIGINLKNIDKKHSYIYKVAEVLDDVIRQGIAIELLVLNSKPQQVIPYCGENILVSDCNGVDLAAFLKKIMKEPVEILAYEGTDSLSFLNKIAGYKGLIGERLHSVMAAYHTKVNFMSIPYHDKVNKFLDMFELNDKAIDGSPESMKKAIIELWQN